MVGNTGKNDRFAFTEAPSNKVIRLVNNSCPYCGVMLAKETTTKEHVIGRRFVPKGKLDGCWNLIVNACQTCNGIKADLENDISAITMQPDALGRFSHNDAAAESDAGRKAKNSYSRRTRRLVKDSRQHTTLNMPFGQNARFSFTFTGAPQLDRGRVFELARLQLLGFFYWITFRREHKCGSCWPGVFYPIMQANRADWGNPVICVFSNTVQDWRMRVAASNADGFFKILIKKHPFTACWSWVLEWNQTLRVVGLFGDGETVQKVAASLPTLEMKTIADGPAGRLRYRIETPLPEGKEDKLFSWDDETE